jgi:transposase
MGRSKYPPELQERAVRMVTEVRASQAEVDAGQRVGVSSEEHAEIKRLKREVAELRRANEILKAASVFFAAELDRPPRRS